MRYLTKSAILNKDWNVLQNFSTPIKKMSILNTSNEDSFLQSLAEGGFQVGELAKFYFHDNPIEESITIESSGEET